jgi:hypothetical protein
MTRSVRIRRRLKERLVLAGLFAGSLAVALVTNFLAIGG